MVIDLNHVELNCLKGLELEEKKTKRGRFLGKKTKLESV